MPGKVNPVIPEAASQVSMIVFAHDAAITCACASGNLELNPFLPLVAACLLESIDLLANASDMLRLHCVAGIEANEEQCRRHVRNSTATAAALLPVLGYEGVCRVIEKARKDAKSVRQVVTEERLLTVEEFEELISPEAVCRLGTPMTGARKATNGTEEP